MNLNNKEICLWGDKRYNNVSNYFKKKFGEKIIKISVDAGFTCPNRDGKISSGGCVFCSDAGSGEFAGNKKLSISEQFYEVKKNMSKKWPNGKYIIHFQPFTNTYGDVNLLRSKYEEALSLEDVVGIAISTRPDCINNEVLNLLDEINKRTYLFIELGLQTSNDKTAKIINRGYELKCFEDCLIKLRQKSIEVVVHVIFGLIGETSDDALETIKYLSHKDIQGIKMHVLYVVKNTPLEKKYINNELELLKKDEYVKLVVESIEMLRSDIVIHRLTGDGKKDETLGPMWTFDKMRVLSEIDKELNNKNSFQGIKYK